MDTAITPTGKPAGLPVFPPLQVRYTAETPERVPSAERRVRCTLARTDTRGRAVRSFRYSVRVWFSSPFNSKQARQKAVPVCWRKVRVS